MLAAPALVLLHVLLEQTCAMAAAVPSLEVDGIPAGMRKPDVWYEVALEDYEDNTFSDVTELSQRLERRKLIKWCKASPEQATLCSSVITGGSTIVAAAIAFGGIAYSSSQNHDCTKHTGSHDQFHWSEHFTGSTCHTTATRNTFEGASYACFSQIAANNNNRVCGCHCVRYTHGGSWTSYNLICPSDATQTDFDQYCGPSLNFSTCQSNGSGSAPNAATNETVEDVSF